MLSKNQVKQGTVWTHTNGNEYKVIMLTNVESSQQEKYPTTVVYENTKNLNKYSRPLHDWHRSMTPYLAGSFHVD